MRDGLPTRTSYFTTISRGDTTSYWRFELVFAKPRVYQFGLLPPIKLLLRQLIPRVSLIRSRY